MPISLKVACVFAAVAGAQQTDKGWELRVTNSEGPVARTCFDTKVSVQGSYYIAGPAKFNGDGWKYQAMMDGIGMVNKFELRPQDAPTKMCYTSAWMNTGVYDAYTEDPQKPPRGVIFEDTEPSRKTCFLEMCDYKAANDNNWVNMMVVGNTALWVSDTPKMVKMDLDTLNVTGLQTWSDSKSSMGSDMPDWFRSEHLPSGGSAHPLPRPGTTTYVELISEMPMVVGHNYMDIYTFDASAKGLQGRTKIASVKADKTQYIHSFGVTPNYVVLPFDLATSSLGPGHMPFLLNAFEPSWAGLQVVDLKGNVQVFDDLDSFYHVHISNTFENASGITMDLGVYSEIPFTRMPLMNIADSLNKTVRDSSKNIAARGQMRRIHMNLETKKTTVEKLTDNKRDYDFIKINPALNGVPHCIYYAVEWFHDDVAYASMALMKHDICQGKKTFWNQPDVYINEPFFIQSSQSAGEDDGTVIFTANDGQKGKAIFVSLDAKTFKEIERIELPNHLPFTAHGHFIPAAMPEVVVV